MPPLIKRSKLLHTALLVIFSVTSIVGAQTSSAFLNNQSAKNIAEAADDGITLPAGYTSTVVENNFPAPTKVVWAPATTWATAGERFMSDHTGVVYRTNIATGKRTVLTDISAHVNSYTDRGLNSIAVDPDYATNKYLYLWYTYENDASKPSACKTSTLTRVTVSATGASAETTLLGSVHGGGTCTFDAKGNTVGSACPAATTADCLPSDYWSHSVGDIQFASDKTIFLTLGDGASYVDVDGPRAYRAQNPDSLAGKMLHITRTGAGLTTNPYANGQTNTNRSKVWSMGDRNQFRFTLVNDVPLGGNVGWSTTEEIERSTKGSNNGWPCYEGNVKSVEGYADTTQCKAMYNAGTVVNKPLVTYNHNGADAAVTGGIIVTGTRYPLLTGSYIYGDYAQSTISTLKFDANFNVTTAPAIFATNASGPVQFAMGPDGYLYYVAINQGELRRIDYAAGNCANNQWKLEYYPNQDRTGNPTHTVCENVGTTSKLTKDWGTTAPTFTPADPAFPANNFSVRATCNCSFDGGAYDFTAVADDYTLVLIDGEEILYADDAPQKISQTLNGTHQVKIVLVEGTGLASVNVNWGHDAAISQPGLAIGGPLEGQKFHAGDTVAYNASLAVDYAGLPLPASAVAWQIQLHHCYSPTDCHVHIVHSATGTSGTFVMPTPDSDDGYLTVRLSATDPSTGLSQTISDDIYYIK